MAMRSWVLKSWPEVFWHLPASASLWPVFHHMGTVVGRERDESGRAVGETVWASQLEDGALLGVAWEWVEVGPGIPALRDPNCFISNGRLLDVDGLELDELQSIVGLNCVAHTTPWHRVVLEAACTSDAATSWSEGVLDWPRALINGSRDDGPACVWPRRDRPLLCAAASQPAFLAALAA